MNTANLVEVGELSEESGERFSGETIRNMTDGCLIIYLVGEVRRSCGADYVGRESLMKKEVYALELLEQRFRKLRNRIAYLEKKIEQLQARYDFLATENMNQGVEIGELVEQLEGRKEKIQELHPRPESILQFDSLPYYYFMMLI